MRACQTANLEIVTLLLQQPNVTIDYLTPCSNNAIFCTLSNTNPNKTDAVISILKLITNIVNCNDTCYINSILNKSTTKPILLQTLMSLGYPINEEQDIATLKYRVHPNLYQIVYDHLFDYEWWWWWCLLGEWVLEFICVKALDRNTGRLHVRRGYHWVVWYERKASLLL